MSKWLLLAGAIIAEVTATLSLKAALDHPAWYVLVVVGYAGAFVSISQAMRQGLPLGVAYGIWASLGVALTAVLSHFLFEEPLTTEMIVGLALIIAGVLLIELGSQHAQRLSSPTSAPHLEAEETQ